MPAEQKIPNLEKCPGPQQQSRSSLDSSFKGYFSDGVFTFSGSQVPVDAQKSLAGGVIWPNTGECAISIPKQPKKRVLLFRGANRSSELIR